MCCGLRIFGGGKWKKAKNNWAETLGTTQVSGKSSGLSWAGVETRN